jgi:hypothetical protein
MEEMHAITPCEIEALLIDLRGQKVMLDRDVVVENFDHLGNLDKSPVEPRALKFKHTVKRTKK